MQTARRTIAVLLALVLGLVIPALSVQANEIAPLTAAASGHQASDYEPSSGDCAGCGIGNMAMSVAVCFAVCSIRQADDSGDAVASEFPVESFPRFVDQRLNGRASMPEPYPPKLTILS